MLFAVWSPALRQGGLFAAISREGSLILNNLWQLLPEQCRSAHSTRPVDAWTGTTFSVGALSTALALGTGFKMAVMDELLANAGLAWVILSAAAQVVVELRDHQAGTRRTGTLTRGCTAMGSEAMTAQTLTDLGHAFFGRTILSWV